jgi:hypothetical protein
VHTLYWSLDERLKFVFGHTEAFGTSSSFSPPRVPTHVMIFTFFSAAKMKHQIISKTTNTLRIYCIPFFMIVMPQFDKMC